MKLNLLMLTVTLGVSTSLTTCKKSASSNNDSSTESSEVAAQAVGKTSPAFDAMLADYLKITKREQVNPFLQGLEKKLGDQNAAADFVFTASLMTLSTEFESIANRMVTLLEKNNVSVHSALVTSMMGLASLQTTYLPTDQARALFSYVTAPRETGALPPINTLSEVQTQLTLVAARLEKIYTRLDALRSKVTDESPIVFDNKLAYGPGSFPDDIKRFYNVGTPELEATLASIKMNLHGIHVFNAYNLDDLPKIVGDLGNRVGMDGRGLSSIEGLTAFHKAQIIRNYPNFWTLKSPGDMTAAGAALKRAADHAKTAWDAVVKRDGTNAQNVASFDQFFYNPGRQSLNSIPNRTAVKNLVAMMQGQTQLISTITKEDAVVNIPMFYSNPPRDLKGLLPTEFVGAGSAATKMKKTLSGVEYRDYLWGSPLAWDMSKYQPYIAVSTKDEIRAKSRILSQSWGGWVGTPLVALML